MANLKKTKIDGKDAAQIIKLTSAELNIQNPVIEEGVFCLNTTNKTLKIGDGVSVWKDLDFIESTPAIKFSESDWLTISEIAEQGKAIKYFSVGDEKKITLSTGEEITLVILGFNHDDLTSGGKAPITIGMRDCSTNGYSMYTPTINNGGWDACAMRSETLPALFSQLPTDLQSVIKPVNKKVSSGNASTTIITLSENLWFLSEEEVSGTKTYGTGNEGKQYEYWKTIKDGTLASDRLKKWKDVTSGWWLRSPSASEVGSFCQIFINGNFSHSNGFSSIPISFGFCI